MRRILFFLFLSYPFIALAQSNNAPSSKDPHEITITGYLQTQYQSAQSEGILSYSGGDFSENSKDRFMIRRGRLKIDRVDKYSNIVFQLDATQNGVALMDAFVQLHHPDAKDFQFTAGLFNRPFGYSIVYSSGYRDFPERARVFQTIMPRERDLGAMVNFDPQNKALKFLAADLAIINGSGYSSRDYDSKKDIVGNLSFKFDSLANKKLHIGFGGSFYKGSVRNDTESYYTNTVGGYIQNINPNYVGYNAKRNYFGGNLQLQYDGNLGSTSFKAEYVGGAQPGVANSDKIPGTLASQSFSTQPVTDLYLREFSGYYLWLSHQIAKSRFTALLAYDSYDPNTNVKEREIGAPASNTTAGDIKFNTLGYGMICQINGRIKLTVYNEHVVNDRTQLADYSDDLKDDVFTMRLQYRW